MLSQREVTLFEKTGRNGLVGGRVSQGVELRSQKPVSGPVSPPWSMDQHVALSDCSNTTCLLVVMLL